MGMRGAFIKVLLLSAVPLGVAASDFEDMVAAEKAFAADASVRTTREAFLTALTDDAVMFDPGPANGKRVWEARAPDKHRLEWTPELAEISASGDLGYTSGPWRFTSAGETTPKAFGHFLSVWQKQPDGQWKLLVDHGIDHPEVAFPTTVQRRGGVGVGPPPTWPVGLAELRNADLLAPGELNSRLVSADFLRLRQGQVPDGRAEGLAMAGTPSRVDTGLVISAAGDLAATWGGGPQSPAWMRIWRRPSAEDAPGRGWTLAAELVLPAPRPVE